MAAVWRASSHGTKCRLTRLNAKTAGVAGAGDGVVVVGSWVAGPGNGVIGADEGAMSSALPADASLGMALASSSAASSGDCCCPSSTLGRSNGWQ
jgi:hypothetical protein